jgi:Domain of unknown function (DUF1707)/Cell wall-active antibiotics response 4TMS YvqF
MSSSPAVPDPQHLRASDADRERVAETLRQAAGDGRLTMDELDERLDAVYAAKTYAELVPITQDLPDHSGAASVPAPSRPTAGDVRQYGGEPASHTAVAILGGFSRKGDWVVPKTFNAFMLLGGGEIDLRDARFAEREVSIHVVAILGGCEITVPEDATVNVNGVGIMGAFEHSAQGAGVSAGGPVINISGVAFMGGVDVTRKPPKKSKRDKLEAKRLRELG